tara:strand:+ start:856 stop:1227 length:372 start_codon:yes stop_codon:yes gene_type:complete
MIKRFFYWVSECWNIVMNVKYNPLKYIPDPSIQYYFTLVLFTMWSAYFGFVAIFYMGWLGYNIITSIIVHMCVLIPVIFTNAVFKDAQRDGAKWYLDFKEQERIRRLFTSKKNIVRWDIDKEA